MDEGLRQDLRAMDKEWCRCASSARGAPRRGGSSFFNFREMREKTGARRD